MPANYGPALCTLWILLTALTGLPAEERGFPVPGVPYGLAHDGNHFWFTELSGRKLYRTDSRGRMQAYFYGNRYLYGIRFSPFDGYIYAGSRGAFYRYNPITGKQMDRLSVPVERVAGLAFGPGVIYLLEKGNGKVYVYSPDSGRILYSGDTGLKEARDIAFYRGQLWITEGDQGMIHRFDPSSFRRTGRLEAPSKTLRGLTFVKGELWIIDRDQLRLEPVFFSEGPNFIAGQEQNRSLLYRISWDRNLDRTLVVVLPASGRGQRVGSPMLSGNFDVTYLSDGTRVVLIRPGRSTSSKLEFRVPIALRSVDYLFSREDSPELINRKGCFIDVKQGIIEQKPVCRPLYKKGQEPAIPGPREILDSGVRFLDSVHDLELLRIPEGSNPAIVYSVDDFDPSQDLDDLRPENVQLEIFLETDR
ncbi:MAG TPA: hypothetical protein DEA96_12065 [Leptospiraceae bacterium]|nr:hypothetical protein [Spirochaetaceae bacterium]HBS05695.1 hypothetical protein [Leptospiraceae bacterium]|tara:strand:+ start:117862 stop:119118 length:1257 start_codon:yes stop_codon:yes gene_type:complete